MRPITFNILPQTGEEEQRHVSEQMAVIRNDMKKIWKQNVFYDIGEVVAENTPVAWMDFKAYCLDGNLYSLLFMFQTQARSILGNFHCSFPIYDIWKPVVLKLLTTIQAEKYINPNQIHRAVTAAADVLKRSKNVIQGMRGHWILSFAPPQPIREQP